MGDKIDETAVITASTGNDPQTDDITKRIVLTAGTLVCSEDVLHQIFNYLDGESLRTCRQICRIWEEVATEIILHRRSLKICFYWEAPYFMTSGHNEEIKLSEMSDLMKKSRLFPCQKFSFHEGNMNDEGIQNFLTTNGDYIKELHLDLYWDNDEDENDESKAKVKIMKKLLGEQCIKLEAINFHFASETWDSDCEDEDDNQNQNLVKTQTSSQEILLSPLLCLKFITIDRKIPTRVFDALLSAAVNLQEIYFDQQYPYGYLLDDYNLDSLIRTNKLYLLKNLSFLPYATDLQLYEAIVTLGLNLETIKIYLCYIPEDEWGKAGRILSKSFLRSSSQLKKILHFPPLGFVPHFVIPTLPALKEVKIANYHSGDGCFEDENPSSDVRIFPSGFCPKYAFPNLERVELDFRQGENLAQLQWEDYFQDDVGPIPSVKRLTFSKESETLSSEWIRKLGLMFPNLASAEFPVIFDILGFCNEIWKFQFLEDLKLKIGVTTPTTISFQAVFEALTGFAKDTCAAIFSGEELYSLVTAEMERVKPSIIDLKRLKKVLLCFCFCPYCDQLKDDNNASLSDECAELQKKEQCTFNEVVSAYALLFCPNLDVRFNCGPEEY